MFLKRLSFALILLAAAAAAAYGWRWQQAQEIARAWVNNLRPVGILRSAQVWPAWDRRSIVMEGITFEPVGGWQQWLRAPIGYQLKADRLILTLADEKQPLSRAQVRALGVRAPLIDGYNLPAPLLALLEQAPPSMGDLNISELRFDAELSARQQDEQRVQFTVQVDAPDLLRFYWDANLHLSQEDWQQARWGNAGVDAQSLELADLGYFTKAKEILAARARTDAPGYEQMLLERLTQQAEQQNWRWSDASTKAVQNFVRKPDYLAAQMNPLSTVALANLGLYAPGDLFQLFALELNHSGEFQHPTLAPPKQ